MMAAFNGRETHVTMVFLDKKKILALNENRKVEIVEHTCATETLNIPKCLFLGSFYACVRVCMHATYSRYGQK